MLFQSQKMNKHSKDSGCVTVLSLVVKRAEEKTGRRKILMFFLFVKHAKKITICGKQMGRNMSVSLVQNGEKLVQNVM